MGRAVLRSACLSVTSPCLYVRSHISKSLVQIYQITIHITSGRDSVLHRRQCNTLCTSGFAYDVMFSHYGANGPESKTTCMLCLACHVVPPGAKLVYECRLVSADTGRIVRMIYYINVA